MRRVRHCGLALGAAGLYAQRLRLTPAEAAEYDALPPVQQRSVTSPRELRIMTRACTTEGWVRLFLALPWLLDRAARERARGL